MCDHATTAAGFDLQRTTAATSSGTLQALNACVGCCDRYALPGWVALFWEGKDGSRASYTFSELKAPSGRFANFLQAQGIRPSSCVASLLPRTPELLVTILGARHPGVVYQPLLTAFGPKAIEHRAATAGSKALVTDAANRDKLDELADPPLAVTAGELKGQGIRRGGFSLWAELERYLAEFGPVPRSGEDPLLMMFTSGTTGLAKPVPVPPKAILAFVGYLREAVDLRPEGALWNLADPSRAYGLYYAVAGLFAMGHPTIFYEGPLSVENTCRIIRDYGIINLAGSPTAYRLLMAAGAVAETALKGRLRAVNSVGELLASEVIRWSVDRLGTAIHGHYGQTELGMVLCNHHALAHLVRVGAAEFACPGRRMIVLDGDLNELPPGQSGILVLDRWRSPLMWFLGHQGLETAAFVGDYYLSGDTVELNEDGSTSFVGRADDVTTTSGYRVGPFDVENASIEHSAVMEAVAIGKPDPERTGLVGAFVVPYAGYWPTPELVDELQRYVCQCLSAHAYPREIEFLGELPKTSSGKIQRLPLRNQEIVRQREAAPQAAAVN